MPKIGGSSGVSQIARVKYEEKHPYLESKEKVSEFEEQNRGFLSERITAYATSLQLLNPTVKHGHVYDPEYPVAMPEVQFEPIKEQPMEKKAKHKEKKVYKESKKKMGSLSQYDSQYTAYIRECQAKAQSDEAAVPTYESVIAKKNELMAKKFNPDIFSKEYFGRNYAQVARDMEEYRRFVTIYGQGGSMYDTLSEMERERITVCKEMYETLADCYEKALHAHGLKTDKTGTIVSVSKEEVQTAEADLALSVETAKKKVKGSDEEFKDRVASKLQDKHKEKKAELLQEDFRKKQMEEAAKKFPRVNADLFKYDYIEGLDKYLSALGDPQYAENVAKHKELLDWVMQDYMHVTQVLDGLELDIKAWMEMGDDLHVSVGNRAITQEDFELLTEERLIQNETTKANNRAVTFRKTHNQLSNILESFIFGQQKIGVEELIALKAYGYEPEESKAEFKQQEEAAVLYKTEYEERQALYAAALSRRYGKDVDMPKKIKDFSTNRAFMLMKKNDDAHNDAVLEMFESLILVSELESKQKLKQNAGSDLSVTEKMLLEKNRIAAPKMVESLVVPKLQAILDFNVSDFQNLTPAELMKLQPKLLVTMAGMAMSDITGRAQSDIPGLTVKEKMLGKPPISLKSTNPQEYGFRMEKYNAMDQALRSKLTILEGVLRQARAVSLLSRGGALDSDDPVQFLTKEEAHKIVGKDTHKDQSVRERVIRYAGEQLDIGRRYQAGNEQALLTSEAVRNWFANDMMRPDQYRIGRTTAVHGGDQLYDSAKKKIEERAAMLKGMGSNPTNEAIARELYEEARLAGDEQTMLEMSLLVKCQVGGYTIAGNREQLLTEPLFRNFGPMEALLGIRDMKPEEFRQMLSDISAGAFLEKGASIRDFREARKRNIAGFRTYFSHASVHYEAFVDKVGLEIPDISYVVTHFDELSAMLKNVQEDSNMVMRDKQHIFRDDNPADVRLKHLILYASSYASLIRDVFRNLAIMGPVTQLSEVYSSPFFDSIAQQLSVHRDYLKANPKGV